MGPLEILYECEHLVAINKPNGLLVHRSHIASDADVFAVQLLRDQLGRRVYPVHRLDRKTSGVLLFALDEATNREMQRKFMEGEVAKTYHAIVRGYTPDDGKIDYPLKRDDGVTQEAVTYFETLLRTEVPFAAGTHPTSRYSLVKLNPVTGRMHQLRKHMAHILHPIIGDRPHGCNKQNRFFKEHLEMIQMMLHAQSVQFNHLVNGEQVIIEAGYQPEFARMTKELKLLQ
ncbi:pseudouridine synthase [Dyadobacter sp. CY261]|uniref:pseudouridine synthase n=1 Tax=Dyadobacter sp. CY261 TaxID=2907203 RepID=UPI001F178952|nr:pseudouridine synthase [Dyadobacter sp. CY261]MCF0075111.1 pseudouridine synthase [Dyadobacter sp. CY261]